MRRMITPQLRTLQIQHLIPPLNSGSFATFGGQYSIKNNFLRLSQTIEN